jgi:flavodoxin
MKTAVVFYTRDGSTRIAAEVLAKKVEADVFELEEVKLRGKSALSFMAAGFRASTGWSSRLKNNFAAEMKGYETIYVGSPVWAGKTTPAFNAFVKGLDAAGKQLVLFTVQADPAPEAKPPVCLEAHKQALEKRGGHVIQILRLHGTPPGKTADTGDIQTQIDARIKG